MITFHNDGTWTSDRGERGFWTRHFNGRVDRGVKLGQWQGCHEYGADSPKFDKKRDLAKWLEGE